MQASRLIHGHLKFLILFSFIFAVSIGCAHAVSITYGPLAWTEDTPYGVYPTSAKLIWRTDTATSTNSVYLSESPAGPWTLAGTDSTGTRHEVPVSGLTGNARYYAYVSSNGVNSPVIEFRTGRNELVNGSFEAWHPVSGESWGEEEPDGWHGWEIFPWMSSPNHITIQRNRNTGEPTPLVKDGDSRLSMDRGWRTCYGGVYQEITGLDPGTYTVSGWVAWLYFDLANVNEHVIEIIAKDGPHVPRAPPTGHAVFSQNGSQSDTNWMYVHDSVQSTTGTLTIYANLRADHISGASFAHFDGFRVIAESEPAVRFSNFQSTRVINGDKYDITITYNTDIPTTTQLQWGPTTSYGNTTPLDPQLVTNHEVNISGVDSRTTAYHYRVRATAPNDIEEFSSDQRFDAPRIVISGISSSVESEPGTICTIRWNTNYPTPIDTVHYRMLGSGAPFTEVVEPDSSPKTSHLVTLSGLLLGTQYEFYVSSGGSDIIVANSSPTNTFQTPVQPGLDGIYLGMAMIGGSVPDGGDDVGPAREVSRMIQLDHPLVNIGSMSTYSWPIAQPNDPGNGPNVYNWSVGDAANDNYLPGEIVTAYFQIYGNTPSWLELNTPRYWEKFEEFVEAMTIHMNERYNRPVYFTFENEPNSSRAPGDFPGNWADWYMHCLRPFYTAVHRGSAQTGMANKVIVGNLAGHSANGFDELYHRGLKNYSDILGYHAYPYHIREGVKVSDLARIREIQLQHGDPDKRIYVSEGWGSGRSAGFERSSPTIEPCALEIENMWLSMVVGWDNVMTPRTNWEPEYLFGMKFFCGNDNWGAMNWRKRATPVKDGGGNVIGFWVDGYYMDPDIAPKFWNGGMMDWYGNSKDALIHVFPGNGLVFMNPGFEIVSTPPDAHLPHFWTPTTSPALEENYSVDDAIFHGGGNSLRLARTTSGTHGVNQLTAKRSALPGVEYRVRVWAKTENVSGIAARMSMRFSNIDGSQVSTHHWANPVTGTSDWQQIEVQAIAPSYTSRIEVGCYISGRGTVWFDDVTIARADQEEIGVIRGYTLDEGQLPVGNVIVRTTTGGYQTVSDDNGYYEITNVGAGTYDVVSRKEGYVPHRVKNQTVAPGRLTFVSFNMGTPKAGLTVTEVTAAQSSAAPGENVNVTVSVTNSTPYPIMMSDVGVFVEQNGQDGTGNFVILQSPENPRVAPANNNAQFEFALRPLPSAEGQSFSINAYAFGQEDRPNLLTNGDFDLDGNLTHWGFWSSSSTSQWSLQTSDYHSAPHSLRWYLHDTDGGKFNFGSNYSAYGASAPPASPARRYLVGSHHKDVTSGHVEHLLFIQEFYYDGNNWLVNGRRFSAIPSRSAWSHDVMLYETGDPNVTPGLYAANRLLVSVGSWHRGSNSSATQWWDDLYLKEEGDWLADDRSASPASLVVAKSVSSLSEAFQEAAGAYVQVSGLILTAGSESFESRAYIQQADRAMGALVELASGAAPSAGSSVAVTGRVGQVDGERALLDATMSVVANPGVPEPLTMSLRSVAPEYLVTHGLLINVWGRVTHVSPDQSFFIVDDGSGAMDASGHPGVRVVCDGTVEAISPPVHGTFVLVTGISGCEQNGLVSVIRPRGPSDIR